MKRIVLLSMIYILIAAQMVQAMKVTSERVGTEDLIGLPEETRLEIIRWKKNAKILFKEHNRTIESSYKLAVNQFKSAQKFIEEGKLRAVQQARGFIRSAFDGMTASVRKIDEFMNDMRKAFKRMGKEYPGTKEVTEKIENYFLTQEEKIHEKVEVVSNIIERLE